MRKSIISSTQLQAIKLAWPMVLSQLGFMLQGVTDTLMVGPLGHQYISSSNMANNVFFLICSFFMGILFSVSTLVSIKDGEGNRNQTGAIYKAGAWFSVILSTIAIVPSIYFVYNFHLLGQVPEINQITPPYLLIISLSMFPMLLFVAARQFSDGLGLTKASMYISIVGFFINIPLNGIGIYGWLTHKPMGIIGAGYATLASRMLMAAGLVVFIMFNKQLSSIVCQSKLNWAMYKKQFAQFIKLGVPLGMQFFAEVAAFAIGGLIVGSISSIQAAAHSVALTVAALTYMAVSGIAQAGGILSGNFFGEQNVSKLKNLGWDMLKLCLVFQTAMALVLYFFRIPIAQAFNLHGITLQLTVQLLLFAALFQLADGMQVTGMNLLRGIKDVRMSMYIAILSYWVIPIPVGYYFGKVLGYGAAAIWWGFLIGLSIAGVSTFLRYFYQLNKAKKIGNHFFSI